MDNLAAMMTIAKTLADHARLTIPIAVAIIHVPVIVIIAAMFARHQTKRFHALLAIRIPVIVGDTIGDTFSTLGTFIHPLVSGATGAEPFVPAIQQNSEPFALVTLGDALGNTNGAKVNRFAIARRAGHRGFLVLGVCGDT
jgi:hypothetical protein